MGYIRHHAIVVIGTHAWFRDEELPRQEPREVLPTIFDAHRAAIQAGCSIVTSVAGPGVNGYSSFLVGPDGSKEGWGESDKGDASRDAFIAWLRENGRGGFYSWAEVVVGSDDGEAHVERNAWDRDALG